MTELITKLAKEPADFAADAMGKKFVWDSLPPHFNPKERETCVFEDGEFMQNGRVFNRVEFHPEVEVKLVRAHCVRLVVEEGALRLYYNTENSTVYHEEEPQFLELSVESAPIVNHLISEYPEFTKIEDLPLSTGDEVEKIQVVSDLWERGLIFTKDPLEPCDYDDAPSMDSSDSDNDSNKNSNDEEDVESINLSDLPAEGQDGDTTEESDSDGFYHTSEYDMGDGVDEDSSASEAGSMISCSKDEWQRLQDEDNICAGDEDELGSASDDEDDQDEDDDDEEDDEESQDDSDSIEQYFDIEAEEVGGVEDDESDEMGEEEQDGVMLEEGSVDENDSDLDNDSEDD